MSKKVVSLAKRRKKKNLKQTLKKAALIVLALSALAGAGVGGKYVYDGMPHLKVGECILDSENNLLLTITDIKDGRYSVEGTIDMGFAQMHLQGSIAIRDFNKLKTITKVNCDTGQPL